MNVEKREGFSFRKLLAAIAFFGFSVSLIVHLISYLGVNVSRYVPFIWLLHLGIFVVFVPLIISTYSLFGITWGNEFWRKFFAPMPQWARYVTYSLFAYVMLNFILFVVLSGEGSPDIVDSRYVLLSGGKVENQRVIREITEDEYDLRNAQIIRGFSGHWLVFYLIPALHFWYSRREAYEDEAV